MLGIDLGTTFSAVATLDATGRAITVPNSDGDLLTPSAVYLAGDQAVVGQAALDIQSEQPDRVATLIKRRMGYADFGRPIDGREFRPETLSAIVLKKIVRDTSARVTALDPVVITVPAYFDDTRRKATQDAGRIAGITVADVFDEPCAAALSYMFDRAEAGAKEQFLVVYDLGGGTFDVSVVRASRKRFHTVAIAGDVQLGGHDWDQRLIDHAAVQFAAAHGADPRDDPKSLALLSGAAERAKRTLSKLPRTTITVSYAGHSLVVPITRAEFESMTRDLLTRTRLTVNEALRQAGLTWDRVDQLLMVGGSTHMPMTRAMLREVSGKTAETGLAVSELVARGAAIHAGIRASQTRAKEDDFADVVEIHVNAHGLGVEVRDKDDVINDVVIPKNTQLPASATRTYRTVRAGQRQVRVRVLQGDARQAAACLPVGECWIEDLPDGLPMGTPVEVTCTCAENGIVSVTARDPGSGRTARATLHRAGGLTDGEIEQERAWVDSLNIL